MEVRRVPLKAPGRYLTTSSFSEGLKPGQVSTFLLTHVAGFDDVGSRLIVLSPATATSVAQRHPRFSLPPNVNAGLRHFSFLVYCMPLSSSEFDKICVHARTFGEECREVPGTITRNERTELLRSQEHRYGRERPAQSMLVDSCSIGDNGEKSPSHPRYEIYIERIHVFASRLLACNHSTFVALFACGRHRLFARSGLVGAGQLGVRRVRVRSSDGKLQHLVVGKAQQLVDRYVSDPAGKYPCVRFRCRREQGRVGRFPPTGLHVVARRFGDRKTPLQVLRTSCVWSKPLTR